MNNIMKKVSILTLAFGLTTSVLHAQDGRINERLEPPAAGMINSIIDSARTSGIPPEPLVQKALQGAAKGASPERIASAVRRLAGDLGSARSALGGNASVAELEAGASAIHAGVRSGELTKLRKARPKQPLIIALATLSDLVSRGVPVDVATSAVSSLVARGAQDEEIIRMQRDVDRDIKAGVPPGSAAAIRSRQIPITRPTAPTGTNTDAARRRPGDDGNSDGTSTSGGTRPRRGG